MTRSGDESAEPVARGNAVLGRLPEQEYALLAEHLEVLETDWGTLLHQADAVIERVYFPVDALASLLVSVSAEAQVEVGAIGREGMVGISVFLGESVSPHSACRQVPGRMAGLSVLRASPRPGQASCRVTFVLNAALLCSVPYPAGEGAGHTNPFAVFR